MYSALRRTTFLSATIAALCTPALASGQSIAVFGSAEAAGDNTALFLLGAGWNPGMQGWQPYVSAVGYNLRFTSGGTTITRNVFAPQAGLRYQTPVSATQFGAGYAFTDQSATSAGVFPVSAETGKGVFLAFQYNYWGNGSRSSELLGSYGLKTNFLWTRGRMLWRLAPDSPLFVGGEAGLLGDTQSPSFWTGQIGPAAEYRFSPNFRLTFGAGLKVGLSGPGNSGSNAYGRIGFLWLPMAQ